MAQNEVPQVRFTVQGFEVVGENPLDPAETQAVLAPYAGEYSGLDGLLGAADALEQALAAHGHAFHRVVLPPQTLAGGVVRLQVVVFSIGQVIVEGNRHFSEDNVRASLPALRPGSPPDTRAISRALSVANEHPAKSLTMNLRASETRPDAVDAVVQVRDHRPWTLFANLNNTGSPETERSRLTVGGQYSNLFGRDQVLTASYTTSPENADDIQQYSLGYEAPLYRYSGWVSAFYVKSDVDIGRIDSPVGDFELTGSGDFYGLSFRQELPRHGAYYHGWSIGAQDRLFDSDLSTSGRRITGTGTGHVRSQPLSLRYHGGRRWTRAAVEGYVEYVHNLDGGSHNNDDSYNDARAGADSNWDLVRLGVSVDRALPSGWLLRARLDGQYAGETLIPGEQYGVGGTSTVRGFEERSVGADDGASASLEVWTPPVQSLGGLRLLGFYDTGYKHLDQISAGEVKTDTLTSIGLGARWQWRDQLSLALDYGHVINEATGEAADRGAARWHASLFYRY